MAIKDMNSETLEQTTAENNSGMGKDIVVPDIVAKRFNWGAFFGTWIWGLFNKSYITLIVFPAALLGMIPFVGILLNLGIAIWIGSNGNKWAWQNKKWSSVEEFHRVQRRWAIFMTCLSIILTSLCIILFFITALLPMLNS